jgi:hypothetical protein
MRIIGIRERKEKVKDKNTDSKKNDWILPFFLRYKRNAKPGIKNRNQ